MSFRPVGWFHFSIVTAHKFFVLPEKKIRDGFFALGCIKCVVDFRGKAVASLGCFFLRRTFLPRRVRGGCLWKHAMFRNSQRLRFCNIQPLFRKHVAPLNVNFVSYFSTLQIHRGNFAFGCYRVLCSDLSPSAEVLQVVVLDWSGFPFGWQWNSIQRALLHQLSFPEAEAFWFMVFVLAPLHSVELAPYMGGSYGSLHSSHGRCSRCRRAEGAPYVFQRAPFQKVANAAFRVPIVHKGDSWCSKQTSNVKKCSFQPMFLCELFQPFLARADSRYAEFCATDPCSQSPTAHEHECNIMQRITRGTCAMREADARKKTWGTSETSRPRRDARDIQKWAVSDMKDMKNARDAVVCDIHSGAPWKDKECSGNLTLGWKNTNDWDANGVLKRLEPKAQ